MTDDEVERRFEGPAVLDKLLAKAGALADSEDVAQAFRDAVAQGVPASVVIDALWEDEPRFATPGEARALYGNLLGLYDAVRDGAPLDAAPRARRAKVKPPRAEPPPPFGEDGPDEAFVEAAWRYLDAEEKERTRLLHAFDNRQDALVSWLDAAGLSDDAFGLARDVCFEVFAMLALGGPTPAAVDIHTLPAEDAAGLVPAALRAYAEEAMVEAENHEEPLGEAEAKAVRGLVARALAGLWQARGRR